MGKFDVNDEVARQRTCSNPLLAVYSDSSTAAPGGRIASEPITPTSSATTTANSRALGDTFLLLVMSILDLFCSNYCNIWGQSKNYG